MKLFRSIALSSLLFQTAFAHAQSADLSTIATPEDASAVLIRADLPSAIQTEMLRTMSFRKTKTTSFEPMLEFYENPEEVRLSTADWGSIELGRYSSSPFATSIRMPILTERSSASNFAFRETLYLNSDANRMTIDRRPRNDLRPWAPRGDLFLLHRCRSMNIGRGALACVVTIHLNLQADPYRLLDDASMRYHSANGKVIALDLYEAN